MSIVECKICRFASLGRKRLHQDKSLFENNYFLTECAKLALLCLLCVHEVAVLHTACVKYAHAQINLLRPRFSQECAQSTPPPASCFLPPYLDLDSWNLWVERVIVARVFLSLSLCSPNHTRARITRFATVAPKCTIS